MSADVDAARAALLEHFCAVGRFAPQGQRGMEHRQLTDALIAAIRAEYEGNLQRLTEANLAYGAEIDRLRADHQAGTLDVERLIQAADTVAHPAGVPPLSDEWWRAVAAEYDRE